MTSLSLPTSTAVELQDNPGQERHTDAATPTPTPAPAPDDVMQTSLAADSQAPDGGQGWVVIAGCAVTTWWFIGTAYCWGVLQAALVKEGVSSSSTLSFVDFLIPACIPFLGITNARIIRAFGDKSAPCLIGIFILGLGEILSGFAFQSVGGLFVTAGVVIGVGTSICFVVVSTTPAQYFKTKRGVANGIVYAAGGLGGAVISFVLNALLNSMGTAWTFRILDFITLGSGLPAAYLIKQRVPIPPTKFVEWRLFCDVHFILLLAASAIAIFPLLIPPFYLPLYTNAMEMKSSVGAAMVAAFNFSSAIGRLLCGFCCDSLDPLNTFFMSLLLSALSMLILWPVSTSIGPLVVLSLSREWQMGGRGFFSTMPTVIGDVFGSARVSVAVGMIVTGWAGGYLLGAPIAGYILGTAGGEDSSLKAYRPSIFYAGGMALSAAFLAAGIRLKTEKN